MPAITPFRITIDDQEYPCSAWEKVQQGQKVSQEWSRGLFGGMGQSIFDGRDDRSFVPNGIDVSSPPYVRLAAPFVTANITLTGFDEAFPAYGISAKQPDGTNIVYILNGTIRHKVNADTGAVIESITTASAVYGRPALFEGSWRIARGASVDCGTLAIGNGAGTDTITALGSVKALHFAVFTDAGVAKIAKASNDAGTALNVIMLSTDFASFTGSSEVGDSSLRITDLIEWQGELLAIKADGPYRWTADGDARRMQQFVTANIDSPTYDGANSHTHGPYAYWVTTSGIYRLFNDGILPIGFEVDPAYFPDTTDAVEDDSGYQSVVAYGRWIYAARGRQVWQGWIEDDGRVRWLGSIPSSVTGAKLFTDKTPNLWILPFSGDNAQRISLEADGSTRSPLGTPRLNGTGILWMPKWNASRPDRLKQLRKVWYILEGMTDGSVATRTERDGAAVATIDTNSTTTGYKEVVLTPGTSDTFREMRLSFRIISNDNTQDIRLRAWGIEAHTFDVYRARIPLTPKTVRGFSGGIKGMLERLRHLESADIVTAKEPEVNEEFNSYVLGVQEKVVASEGGDGIGYEVDVLLERAAVPA